MDNKIFFSYSRYDSAFVLKLANDLRNAGFSVWLDQLDIPPGKHWDKEIEIALNNANCVLAIISPKSLASDNAMDEISYALEEKKRVIPVMLTDSDTSFRLRRLQRVDFTCEYESGLKQLLLALQPEKGLHSTLVECTHGKEDNSSQQDEKDKKLWEECRAINTVPAYQKYLRTTTSRQNLEEAWGRLEALQEKPANRAINLPVGNKKNKWLHRKNIAIAAVLILLAGIAWGAYKITGSNSNPPENKIDNIAMADLAAGNNIVNTTPDADTLQNITSNTEKIDASPTKQVQKKKSPPPGAETAKEIPSPQTKEEGLTVADSMETPQNPALEPATQPTSAMPSHSPAKRQVVVNSRVVVNLLLIDHPNMHERDKTDQPVKFSVVNDVVYDDVVIIQKGAIAKGTLTIGRVFTDIRISSVTGADGSFVSLKSERAHGRRADVETEKNYAAIVKQGTTITN